MKEVIIVRGCPGSGKTTFLAREYPAAFVCSAVNFHTDSNGQYKFFPKGVSDAHKYCQNAFLAALQNQLPLIAVDNTNIKSWEFEWYIETAEKYGYKVQVLRIKIDDINVVAQRNIHGVPADKVVKMHESTEYFEGEIFV